MLAGASLRRLTWAMLIHLYGLMDGKYWICARDAAELLGCSRAGKLKKEAALDTSKPLIEANGKACL